MSRMAACLLFRAPPCSAAPNTNTLKLCKGAPSLCIWLMQQTRHDDALPDSKQYATTSTWEVRFEELVYRCADGYASVPNQMGDFPHQEVSTCLSSLQDEARTCTKPEAAPGRSGEVSQEAVRLQAVYRLGPNGPKMHPGSAAKIGVMSEATWKTPP